jgi:hypothetical protein
MGINQCDILSIECKAVSHNACNKNAVAKRTLIDAFPVSGAMVHFTFLLLLAEVAAHSLSSSFASTISSEDVSTLHQAYQRIDTRC